VRQVAAGLEHLHNLKVPIVYGDKKSVGPPILFAFSVLLRIEMLQTNIFIDDNKVARLATTQNLNVPVTPWFWMHA
jgi:hypothetical protein